MGFIPPSVRDQLELLLNGCGLAKAQTYSERTLLAIHTVTCTLVHVVTQGTLDIHIYTLLTLSDIHIVIHRHKDTLRGIKKLIYTHFYTQV